MTTDENVAFTSTPAPTITAAEVFLTWTGNAGLGATAPATFTDGTNTILPFVDAASQTAAAWFQLGGFFLDAGSDDINFFDVVTLKRGPETWDVSVSADGVLDFGDNIISITTLGNIILPDRLVEIRAHNLTITAATIGRGAQASPFSRALAITTTEDLELNGNLAMNTGVALNLSFGGSLGGALDLTATNLGITSTGSSAVTLPDWVFGDDTRQLRLNVADITLAENDAWSKTWEAERITLGENTTITDTSSVWSTFILSVPTVEAGLNTLTINVGRIDFLPGAASTITAGAVSLTTTVGGPLFPSDTPSLTITATTGNLTLAGHFTVGDGAMTLTATQGEIVFTDIPFLRAASFSFTQGGAAFAAAQFPATQPAIFRDKAGAAVRPTIRYTGGVQLPVDWAVATSAKSIVETDGGALSLTAGGSIVTTDTATTESIPEEDSGALSLTAGGSIETSAESITETEGGALTLTAYDDIYLPGANLNNADGALSLTAGGSIMTGSGRAIFGSTIGFTQGQARYETGGLLFRAFTGALTIDGHFARDMITLRVSGPNLLDLTDAILEGVVSAVTQ